MPRAHAGGNAMRALRAVALGAVVALIVGIATVPAAAQGSDEKPESTEIGISADEIRIAVVADVENPLAPGLFEGAPNGVKGFAKYINSKGGLAGRKVVVDFIDSHLSPDDARNAIIKACSEDFAIVGTAALFLNNVDDLVGCVDKAGVATGLPEIPIVTTEAVQQCSPVSFPVNAPQLLCSTKDEHPQTFRANRGTVQYYQRVLDKDLHGVFAYSNDLKSASAAGLVLARGSQAGGVKSDGEEGISGRAPQSAFTPLVQLMKDSASNYSLGTGPFTSTVALRKEAKLQGVDPDDVVWDCFSNCYDERLIEQGGAEIEGQYVTLSQLPFSETKQNKALANYVKFTGKDKIDGFGSYAWVAGLLFRDAVNSIVEKDGNNALTRKALLDALAQIHDFDGDGMWGTTDIGNRVPTPCFMLTQVQDGEFTRVYPKKAGTLDCKQSNQIEIEEDLLGA
jgi:ABC-type branched-subunit amino acid transport system substrate-binding protein